MTTKFRNLKEQLNELEEGNLLTPKKGYRRKKNWFSAGFSSPKWFRYSLFIAFATIFFLYAGGKYTGIPAGTANPVDEFTTWVNQPDEHLLQEMGDWMSEMGYKGLSREQLIQLRSQGVTATFTSRMQDLGYKDLPLDELVRLRQNDVSSTFAAMMKELGYNLSTDDLIQLRQHDVTAYYTSNMQDLGYKNLTKDELIRLKDTGVRTAEVRRLIDSRKTKPTIEELIRYHISNQ